MGQLHAKKIIGKKEHGLMAPTIQEMDVDVSQAAAIKFYPRGLWDSKDFISERELGSGASCSVNLVTIKVGSHAGRKAALKQMQRNDEFNPQSFVKEIVILHKLVGHPNILRFENAFIDPSLYFIQTGLLHGGELFDRIHKKKFFTEVETSEVIMVVLDAMLHCHKHQIVHRDLKPENMVYALKNGGAETLTIIDFGDAKYVDDEGVYTEFVGTAFYLPPEIVRERKGKELKKSDVWSIGVIAYVLLTGRPPFFGNGNKEILKKIIRGKVQFPKSKKLSATAKHFVLNMVQKRIEKRFSIIQALNHPFIRNHNKKTIGAVYQRHGIKPTTRKKKQRQ